MGAVPRFILLAWGVAVVSLVDTLVRPYVIGKQVKGAYPPAFLCPDGRGKGPWHNGTVIGPVVLSVTMAVFDMLEEMNSSSPSGQRRYPSLEPRTPKAREGVIENSLST